MLRFDNPGHRAKLHELGILAADQSNIAPADLAQQIIACPQPDEALYILQQEIRTQLTNLRLIDSQLDMAQEAALAISNLKSLDQAINRFQSVVNGIRHTAEIAEGYEQFLGVLQIALEGGKFTGSISEIHVQISAIERFVGRVFAEVQQNQPHINRRLEAINQLIEEKGKAL